MFWANIGLVGGNTCFPGFYERLSAELRSLAPADCEVTIYTSDDPVLEAYRSGVAFAKMPDFAQATVTREEYLEMGSNACRRKFRDWKATDRDVSKGKEPARGKGESRTREDGQDADHATPAKRGGRGRGRGRGSISRRQG